MSINANDYNLSKSSKIQNSGDEFKKNKKSVRDLQSFTGASLYDVDANKKLDSKKVRDSFLSNISFAGSPNAVSFGSGGGYSYSAPQAPTPPQTPQPAVNATSYTPPVQTTPPVTTPQAVNKADNVNDTNTINADDLSKIMNSSTSEKIRVLKTEKNELISKYKEVQELISELDVQRLLAIQTLKELREKIHDTNIELAAELAKEMFGNEEAQLFGENY